MAQWSPASRTVAAGVERCSTESPTIAWNGIANLAAKDLFDANLQLENLYPRDGA